MSLKQLICFLLITISFAAQNKEKLLKKAKLSACLGYANARIARDKSSYEKMTEALGKDKSKPQMGMEHILQVLLINCFQNIEEEQIEPLIIDTKDGNIDKKEYQELIGIGKADPSKLSLEKMAQTSKEINELLIEMKDEEKDLINEMKKQNKQYSTSSNKRQSSSASNKPVYKGEKWNDVIYPINENGLSFDLLVNPIKAAKVFGLQTLCGLIIVTLIIIACVGKNFEYLKKKGIIQEGTYEKETEMTNQKEEKK